MQEGDRVSAETVPADQATDTASITYPGGQLQLPILKATEGTDSIALGKLLAETAKVTTRLQLAGRPTSTG